MESLPGGVLSTRFGGRLGLLQRVLPDYRAAFFDRLAQQCDGGLGVFAGQPLAGEGINSAAGLQTAAWQPARNLHVFDPSSSLYLCWQAGLEAWLEAWQPDALIVEANPRLISTRRAIAWMHGRQRPVLGWGLGAPRLSGPLAGLRGWERAGFLRQLDGMLAYSRRGAAEYRALGLPESRVFVAHNAVAPPPAAPPPARPAQFRGPPTVLFVGRLQPRKRVDLLLRACAALPEGLRPRLSIVGDGPARAEFEALAAQVYPAAVFHGAQRGAALAEHFRAADLLALPGTGGLAIQEGMGYGLPVIAAEGDGTQEDLVRPESGWLVTPGDLKALTAALRLALSDPAGLRLKGAAAYRIVAEEINIDTQAQAFVRALNRVDTDHA